MSGCTTHTRPANCGSTGLRFVPGRGGSFVEPVDLLAALVDEAESRAVELMVQLDGPARVLNALGMEPEQSSFGSFLETLPENPDEPAESTMPLPHSAALRAVLLDASMQAGSTVRFMLEPSTCWRG